jgi:hypothetical protein
MVQYPRISIQLLSLLVVPNHNENLLQILVISHYNSLAWFHYPPYGHYPMISTQLLSLPVPNHLILEVKRVNILLNLVEALRETLNKPK